MGCDVTDHLLSLSHHAYYCGELDAGRRVCERLLASPMDDDAEMLARCNRTWYTQSLDEIAGCAFQRLDVEPAFPGWSVFNPSLIVYQGKLLANVRSSNYQIVGGHYVTDGHGIRTVNLLAWLSPSGVVLGSKPLSADYPKSDFEVDGLEDCRLRHTQTGIGVSATVRNANGYDGRCRIATADLDVESATLSGLRVLSSVTGQEHEKNWMPIHGHGGWMYSPWYDGHVVTVDPDPDLSVGWQLSQRWRSPTIAKRFRGGSQLVPFHEGYLCVIHEVAHCEQRVYEHRFVFFDASFRLAAISPAFAFREKRAIEFAAGLVVLDDKVMISFGVRDAEAWVVTVSSSDVEKLLAVPCKDQQAAR